MEGITRRQSAALNAQLGKSAEEARAELIRKEREAIIADRRPGEENLMTSGVVPPGSEIEKILQHVREGKKHRK